ncbi:MAG: type IV-A pilus assembly ATPase PilB [Burkholderiaceae bacterium]|jgi:type IV pilus assembly protein PilB|nr:type IV-A pilus assembly ATPase PilB [Burkholderiaceae bacterium]
MRPASAPPTSSSSGLPRALLQAGKLSQQQVDTIQRNASEERIPFIDAVIRSGELDASSMALFCATHFGCPLLDLGAVDIQALPKQVIDDRLMQSQRVVVLAKRASKVSVAIADPTQTLALDQVKFRTGLSVDPVVVAVPQLTELISKLSQSAEQNLSELIGDDLDNVALVDESSHTDTATSEIDDAPVVRFLQKILTDAINMGASDLHFEPFEKFYRIRFRIDGVLREISQPPLAIKEKLASRIKVISRLDISEKRVPQDGRMKLSVSGTRSIDFRVSTLPTLFGEKIVMRILDGSQAQLGIDALGYEADQKALLLDAIHRPYGMVLVTGPTGSGKTVSLYTCLNILNKPGINIATAEDPAEINLPGINQVNINDRAGLTFPVALRAFLRQDPDIVMVGEIRDLETADIAIKAAQTGHMVFSTLHTNDAPSTLTRLLNMGVAPFNIASAVTLITAQRLARRLCSCKQPEPMAVDAFLAAGFTENDLSGWTPYRAVGCERCTGSGYKGRVGVYQVMPISEAIEAIILAQGTALEIEAQAKREGVRTLREAGLIKVKQGLTSLDEILGCTNA